MSDVETRRRGEGEVRPGAMTAVMRAAAQRSTDGPKWLRWAWVEDGRVLQERVIGPKETLTWGVDGDLPGDAPKRPLAHFSRGAWHLSVRREWAGRLVEGPLSAIPGRAEADGWKQLELDPKARGRVDLGGGALLIQLVDRPPERTRVPLPASLDGGVMARTDWTFTAFVTASFLAHFAIAVGLMEADWPVEVGLPPPAVAVIIFDEPTPPDNVPEVEPEDADTDGEELADNADATEDAEPVEANPRRSGPTTPRATSNPRATLSDAQAANEAVQLALGTLLARDGSSVQNLLRDGAVTDNQADIMASVDSVQVASANTPLAIRNGGGRTGGANGDLGRLNRRPGVATGPIEGGRPIEEVEVRVTTTGLPPVVDYAPPEWNGMRGFTRQLRSRMTAVQRCYEHEITRGTVQGGGRIRLSLRIMPVGSLGGVEVVENTTGSSALGECAVRAVRTVRVRPPPPEAVDVEYPIVFSRVE
ncbi:MAG: TonB family protein [Sandaracinaceae bacterium]